MQKVLGSSYRLGASIVASYGLLQERMEGRVAGWKFKLLSAGVKKLYSNQLLKRYAMSLFKLPQKVYQRLMSIMLNFWCSGGEEERGIH